MLTSVMGEGEGGAGSGMVVGKGSWSERAVGLVISGGCLLRWIGGWNDGGMDVLTVENCGRMG